VTTIDDPRVDGLALVAPGAAVDASALQRPSVADMPQAIPPQRALPTPIRPRDVGWADGALLLGAAFSAYCAVWVVFYQLTLLSGAFGFFVCWFALFLAVYGFVTAAVVDPETAKDRVFVVLVVSGALLVLGLLVYIVGWVVLRGLSHVTTSLFLKDQAHFEPSDPNVLHEVGILHAIIGSFEQVGLAATIAVPVAVVTAVYLNEVRGRFSRVVRTVVTAMAGTPSIVAGVFIYSFFILPHVLIGKSGIAASLALFILMLPWVTRTTEEVLRLVPSGLREASLALGAPEWRTVWSVVLPTARSGLITAVLLGVAIAIGETAPLIYTAFGSQVMNVNPFHDPQGALPLVVLQNVRQAQAVLLYLAYATAFVLIMIVLVLFVLARVVGRPRNDKRAPLRTRLTSLALQAARRDRGAA